MAINGTAETGATINLTITGTSGTPVTATATATSGTWAFTSLNVNALTDGTITYTVTATDTAGNPAAAAATTTATKDVVAPTIASVVLSNGGTTAGRIETSDTITITFNEQMSVSSFCSTWSGDATNQSLVANNDVVVSLNDGGASNDTLTVASGTCTLNFGSIDLGSASYVSGGSAVFSGNGSSKSTVSWTASTRTLVVLLGGKVSGTTATVLTSTPIYTSGAATDSAGNGISNSPFTLPAAKQF